MLTHQRLGTLDAQLLHPVRIRLIARGREPAAQLLLRDPHLVAHRGDVQPTLQIVIRVQPLVHDAIHTLAIVVADRRAALVKVRATAPRVMLGSNHLEDILADDIVAEADDQIADAREDNDAEEEQMAANWKLRIMSIDT